MSREIAQGLLRGVRMDDALRCCGQVWDKRTIRTDQSHLSKSVSLLNFFISHDWQTPRRHKFLALCLVVNSKAALFVSVIVELLVFVLGHEDVSVLPRMHHLRPAETAIVVADRDYVNRHCDWAVILGPAAFVTVLFMWQRIRSWIIRRP